jgi:peptide/nickel transport system permease protein
MSGRAVPSDAIVVGRPLADRAADERSARHWLRALRRGRRATVGFALVALVALLALFAPWLARHDPNFGDFGAVLAAPSADHWFGTDGFGRDVFARVLYGYRVSVVVAIASVAAALAFGAPLGLLAGYFGATIDNLIMRPLDLLMAFPPILLAITLVAIFDTGLKVTILALAVIYVPIMARILRSSVIATRGEEYVEAARAMGATPARLMLRHVLPNSLGPLVVQASISMGIAILIEATLSFIGLGTQPPDPSLGSMLAEGRDFMRDAPWVVLYPGLAIALAVLGFNLLGDGLRDLIDTRGR